MTNANDRTNNDGVREGGLIHVSNQSLLLSMAPLFIVIIVTIQMELDLSSSILSGTFRTLIQLSILGVILHPIFLSNNFAMVLGYCLIMVIIAAHVSCSRTKYKFQGQFLGVFGSLMINVVTVGLFSFFFIIRPQPVWDPQYVIPIVGMILGNCVNGISLTMNHLSTSLVEQQHEIELYLSFGATYKEAVSRVLREAVQAGTLPLLNSMAVIGIVAIPGMMTGQILGGSSVGDAARYQILIMYLIAMTTFGVVLMEVWIVLRIGFDASAHRLCPEKFVKRNGAAQRDSNNKKTSLFQSMQKLGECFKRKQYQQVHDSDLAQNSGELEPLQEQSVVDYPQANMQVRIVQDNNTAAPVAETFLLSVKGLTRSIQLTMSTDPVKSRTLFKNISFEVKSGEVVIVTGPSGSGKSQLLRSIAALSPVEEGFIQLDNNDWKSQHRNHWRKKVRYVTQYKVDVPGTPSDFIKRVTSFEAWANDPNAPSLDQMTQNTIALLQHWGLRAECITEEWKMLSGGEGQRLIAALALASSPKVLLLDESTSALDINSKLAVEQSIESFAKQSGCIIVLVSHDDEQLERFNRHV
jgi:putative ABC transport system permease protein